MMNNWKLAVEGFSVFGFVTTQSLLALTRRQHWILGSLSKHDDDGNKNFRNVHIKKKTVVL